jgi:hypothetical protein
VKGLLFLAIFSIIAVGQASAADLPVRTAPAPYIPVGPPIYNWGGLYVGINGGYGFGQSQWSDPLNPSGSTSSGDFSTNGASCNQASSCEFDVRATVLPPTAAIGANNRVKFDENIVRVGVNFIFRP